MAVLPRQALGHQSGLGVGKALPMYHLPCPWIMKLWRERGSVEVLFLQPWVWASLRPSLEQACHPDFHPISSSSCETLSLLGLTLSHVGPLWGKVNLLPGACFPKQNMSAFSGGLRGCQFWYYERWLGKRKNVLFRVTGQPSGSPACVSQALSSSPARISLTTQPSRSRVDSAPLVRSCQG